MNLVYQRHAQKLLYIINLVFCFFFEKMMQIRISRRKKKYINIYFKIAATNQKHSKDNHQLN